ncbi:hypothetical protein JA33_295 [Dickeya phage vB_DsoM_JA33]|uniref:Uncharacterized protein n=3 Tax=Salmondvirus TaxID=2733130 RepID=A0A386K748_9CAUD|nr:hypothetical protein HOU08_gp293 [Dickeya phage vB_DsoM_JA29]YP_009813739.1 hypothetical protein HOU32_gp294 [Dickeya phage vB_DsoM_JA11]AXG67019.1 hypothetical protein JA29_293 [Dickeya phage vB_DsoM_JA29]AXG67669.1 hypothetical protein JA33_295 [Dickeya phage vB_DsoM_JA33]AYD80099.1 hypothetical protein JA11_294 [Dickeya phage vB_DsoM_JA11]
MSISEKLAELLKNGKVAFPTGIDLGDFEFAARMRGIQFTKAKVETSTRTVVRYKVTAQ